MSTAGVGFPPERVAHHRGRSREVSAPSRIQSVGPTGSPLSKIESAAFDDVAATKGAHSSPGSAGLLRSVTGRSDSRSPMREPQQHPVEATLLWSLVLIAIFAPLAMRRYRRLAL